MQLTISSICSILVLVQGAIWSFDQFRKTIAFGRLRTLFNSTRVRPGLLIDDARTRALDEELLPFLDAVGQEGCAEENTRNRDQKEGHLETQPRLESQPEKPKDSGTNTVRTLDGLPPMPESCTKKLALLRKAYIEGSPDLAAAAEAVREKDFYAVFLLMVYATVSWIGLLGFLETRRF